MPKQKTHKGAKKRIRVSAGGKLIKKRAFGGHLLTKKTAKRKRRIRSRAQTISASDQGRLRKLLGQ
jgi:large subunit ribosomal protein L35